MTTQIPYDDTIHRLRVSDFFTASDNSSQAMIIHDVKIKMIDEEQLWFWTDEWQEGEKQVERYIAEGNIQEFDTMDDFLNSLQE